jgi:hypothetical protein
MTQNEDLSPKLQLAFAEAAIAAAMDNRNHVHADVNAGLGHRWLADLEVRAAYERRDNIAKTHNLPPAWSQVDEA